MVNQMKLLMGAVLVFVLSGCAAQTANNTLYADLGGRPTLTKIADNFIEEISFDATIYPFFVKSDIKRFRTMFIDHLCVTTDGPCEYKGDTMLKVHQGQKISEGVFNKTVDLLTAAMTKAEVSYALQNRVLARLAPMREEIIYQ
jgi:hemoglobin